MKTRAAIIAVALLVIGGLIALFYFGRQQSGPQLSGNITFWGAFDDPFTIQPLISDYKAKHPREKIDVFYEELNSDIYEQQLIDALAGIDGPDIFMFHSSWLPKHQNKIFPFATDANSLNSFRDLFPTVVQQDFAPDGIIYAYPLYLDTLATYYNQDIFDAKGISLPPRTWNDLEKIIPQIREIDRAGRITKAGAAIGGSNRSINRAADILNLLMLQSGVKMTDDEFRNAIFDSQEGDDALIYYTKFANPRDPSYTWNDSLPYSLDSFAAGETAVMFNYSHQSGFLKEKSPFLRFRVAPMLQPENAQADVNFANYWGIAISNKTDNFALAKDFIEYLATDSAASRKYLDATGKPPALRTLINEDIATKPDFAVFARQALTARSWPQIDNVAIDSIFSNVIADVNGARKTPDRALNEAASQVTDLMQRRVR